MKKMWNKYVWFVLTKTVKYILPCIFIIFLTLKIIAQMTPNSKTDEGSWNKLEHPLRDSLRPIEDDEQPLEDYERPPAGTAPPVSRTFPDALSMYADRNKTILLSLTDSGFLDMTMNFIDTSLARFGIENYLFVSADHAACAFLWRRNIHCQMYMQSLGNLTDAAVYGAKDFMKKMNIRTYMIVEALELGFTVIHSDVDIVFFQNPMADVARQCERPCDVGVMWDHVVHNAGFLIARPTPQAIALYKEMIDITIKKPKLDDQQGLNLAIKTLKKARKLNVNTLDKEKYLNGHKYFEAGKRMFLQDSECAKCLVLHNNWIVSKEAKIYRFKELGMWLQDENGYYSNPNAKFLTYNNTYNPKLAPADTVKLENDALKNALAIGRILNRSVILPSFDCGSDSFLDRSYACPLNIRLRMTEFDKEFGGLYREHVFLQHPFVPGKIKQSVSRLHVIGSGQASLHDDEGAFIVHQPKLESKGASEPEVRAFLGQVTEHVLQLHTLHDAFWQFSNASEHSQFEKQIKYGLKRSTYRQYR